MPRGLMFNSHQPWSCSREPGSEIPSQRWAHSLSVLPAQMQVSPRLGEHEARSPRVCLGSLERCAKAAGGAPHCHSWEEEPEVLSVTVSREPTGLHDVGLSRGREGPWEALVGWDSKCGGGVGLSVALGLTWVRWSLLAFPFAWTPPAHPHPNLRAPSHLSGLCADVTFQILSNPDFLSSHPDPWCPMGSLWPDRYQPQGGLGELDPG